MLLVTLSAGKAVNHFFGGYGMGLGRYGMYFDPTYILVLIGVVISLAASAKVRTTFSRYQREMARCSLTGAQVAERLLHANGIYDVQIAHVNGNLSDHYDPSKKVLRLSDSVYNSRSISAVSVAAHEVGHCIQHARGYVPLSLRTSLVPVANIGSTLSWVFIIAGLFFSSMYFLVTVGIVLFSLAVLFQIVTLPVEFNASHRALAELERNGILASDEIKKGKKVLSAAALTYVAAAAAAILQLLRLLLLYGRRRN